MKKADIKAGVAYAYRRGSYGDPEPCVLLSTELHEKRGGRDKKGPWCSRKENGAKQPTRGWNGADTGYPALLRSYSAFAHMYMTDADLIALMPTVTQDALVSGEVPEGLRLQILTSLTPLLGPWDEIKAEQDAAQARKQAECARRDAVAVERARRAEAVIVALAAHDITASYDPEAVKVTLSLEPAEQVVSALQADGCASGCDHCDSDRMREVPDA